MKRSTSLNSILVGLCLIPLLSLPAHLHAQQVADPNFDSKVKTPTFTRTHPTVMIDEAHSNFHTVAGRYKPFADLLKSDGYNVISGNKPFQTNLLRKVQILVIANASTAGATDDRSEPAFTEAECEAVKKWVSSGGSLLLIADHAPFGSAAEILSLRFGVDMGKGFVFDLKNSAGNPTSLVFSAENGLLADHSLVRGRNAGEKVNKVVSFTGQSLSIPSGAVAILKLSPTAYEAPTRAELAPVVANKRGEADASKKAKSVTGRAQGIALRHGRGRVVILGEAAMFSAQVIKAQPGGLAQDTRMGMNVEGNDDRQFALNVMHWLSRVL